MQYVQLGDKHYTGPERFDDLSAPDFLMIMRYQRVCSDHFAAVLEIVSELFGIPAKLIMKLTDVQAFNLGATVNFLFEPPKFEPWIIKTLPTSSAGVLFGPNDGLDNITFNELMHADQALDGFQKTKDWGSLDKLIAILYRPERPKEEQKDTNDVRIPFNPHHTAGRALQIGKSIDNDIRMAVRLNYIGCRAVLASYFEDLFPPADPDEPVTKEAANGNWLDLAIQMARKEPALGNLHEIESDDAYLVCRLLNQVIKEHNEMEVPKE